ncbi:MAG: hypothetical protein JWR88_1046 [Pseudonocardia sp.]|nr:hypothetical protein [Pseudonocardia sp.]
MAEPGRPRRQPIRALAVLLSEPYLRPWRVHITTVVDEMEDALARAERAEAALARIRERHLPDDMAWIDETTGGVTHPCSHCLMRWPCQDARDAEEPTDG